MAENNHGEQFRALIALMEEQRQHGQDANDIWWQNQEAMEERSSLPSGFFAEAEAQVSQFRHEMQESRERVREEMSNIRDDIRETVDIETPEYKEYVRQREVEDRAFERSLAYMESQEYADAQQWNEQRGANEAAQGRQRGKTTIQLQAFEGKTPEEQRQVYIQQVMQDAIRTGIEEGYPVRDRAGLEKQVAQAATPESVKAYADAVRAEERTSHARNGIAKIIARQAAQHDDKPREQHAKDRSHDGYDR
jgi:hypothetical protein